MDRVADDGLEVVGVRAEFPILRTLSHGRPLVYLDNGATTQKPRAVIDAITRFYEQDNANIHRGVYELSQRATDGFEGARAKVRAFINAAEDAEIIFVRGVTEAVNLVATAWGRANLRAGDEVLISAFEHHSGIVPWQMVCAATGAQLRVIPMDDAGVLDLQAYEKTLAGGRVKMVSAAQVSNSLGTVNDVRAMAKLAHAHGALIFVDGAQHVAHAATDVRAWDVDFYAFSGHKLYGPTGIGVLYGKRALLEAMPPFLGGGDMIERVTFEQTTYAGLPSKFEAGTPDIAGAIGLGAAIDWISAIGMDRIERAERELMHYALEQLRAIPGLRIVGNAEARSGAISFVIDEPKLAAHDVATLLDMDGIAVRSGHHCTQPVMDRLGVPATVRASIAIYNTREDIDALVGSLKKITQMGAARGAGGVETKSGATDGRADALAFPEPSAASVQAAADELVETFEFLGDAEQRQNFLLDLGQQIPAMPAALKTEQTRVHGCMSVVHLFAAPRAGRLDFVADSDAFIVRGLIGLLQKVFAGQRADEIARFDVEGFFRRLKLDQHVTSQRRNGLAAMVKRLKTAAESIASKGGS